MLVLFPELNLYLRYMPNVLLPLELGNCLDLAIRMPWIQTELLLLSLAAAPGFPNGPFLLGSRDVTHSRANFLLMPLAFLDVPANLCYVLEVISCLDHFLSLLP